MTGMSRLMNLKWRGAGGEERSVAASDLKEKFHLFLGGAGGLACFSVREIDEKIDTSLCL